MVDFKALRKSESAFSLTELALVLLGGMIILAAAVPAVNVVLDQYRVILEADPELQKSLSSLGQIYLPSSTATNGQVPLSAIALA